MAKLKKIKLKEYLRQYAQKSRKNDVYKRDLRNVANKIEGLEKFLGKELFTSDFDELMMDELEFYLRNSIKAVKNTTIRNIMRRVIEFLKKAKADDFETGNRFLNYEFPPEEIYSVALSEEEVSRIYNLKKLSKPQNLVRDWFCLNCYVAFRFNDLINLEDGNIEDGCFTARTKKTGKKVSVPAHPIVVEILKKYGGLPPKPTSSQDFNEKIKRICRRAKINGKIFVERHEGTKFVRKNFEKWQMVSAHTARRSFATNAYFAGIPTARIMKMTGHKTEDAFFRYIRIDEKENAQILAEHEFFKPKSK